MHASRGRKTSSLHTCLLAHKYVGDEGCCHRGKQGEQGVAMALPELLKSPHTSEGNFHHPPTHLFLLSFSSFFLFLLKKRKISWFHPWLLPLVHTHYEGNIASTYGTFIILFDTCAYVIGISCKFIVVWSLIWKYLQLKIFIIHQFLCFRVF